MDNYQVWAYNKSLNVITDHKLLATGRTQAEATEMLHDITWGHFMDGVEAALDGENHDEIGFYIRQADEPTYIIYVEYKCGRCVLYDVLYHEPEVNKTMEMLQAVAKRLKHTMGPRIRKIVVDKRDDVEDRCARGKWLADDDLPELVDGDDE